MWPEERLGIADEVHAAKNNLVRGAGIVRDEGVEEEVLVPKEDVQVEEDVVVKKGKFGWLKKWLKRKQAPSNPNGEAAQRNT